MAANAFGITTRVKIPFQLAVEKAKAALKEEGFGVLTTIDVQANVKEKLGLVRRPYLILGACNPLMAHKALEAEPELGLFMPCNVIVYEDRDEVVVSALNPAAALSIANVPGLEELGVEGSAHLQKVIEAVQKP